MQHQVVHCSGYGTRQSAERRSRACLLAATSVVLAVLTAAMFYGSRGSQESLLQLSAPFSQYDPLSFNFGRDRSMIATVPMWATADVPESDDRDLDMTVNSALAVAQEARSLAGPQSSEPDFVPFSPHLAFSLPAGCVGGCKQQHATVKIVKRSIPPSKEEKEIKKMSSTFKRLQRIDSGHYKILSTRILSLERMLREFAAREAKKSSDVALAKTRKILSAQASIRTAKRALDAVTELRRMRWTRDQPEKHEDGSTARAQKVQQQEQQQQQTMMVPQRQEERAREEPRRREERAREEEPRRREERAGEEEPRRREESAREEEPRRREERAGEEEPRRREESAREEPRRREERAREEPRRREEEAREEEPRRREERAREEPRRREERAREEPRRREESAREEEARWRGERERNSELEGRRVRRRGEKEEEGYASRRKESKYARPVSSSSLAAEPFDAESFVPGPHDRIYKGLSSKYNDEEIRQENPNEDFSPYGETRKGEEKEPPEYNESREYYDDAEKSDPNGFWGDWRKNPMGMPSGITAVRNPSYPFKSWRGLDWMAGAKEKTQNGQNGGGNEEGGGKTEEGGSGQAGEGQEDAGNQNDGGQGNQEAGQGKEAQVSAATEQNNESPAPVSNEEAAASPSPTASSPPQAEAPTQAAAEAKSFSVRSGLEQAPSSITTNLESMLSGYRCGSTK
ncbi:hypothetical protein GUITHDRAFT_112311 [Guillardia theta CCMP2712]|uniref:Uncharacterized protein n=2 Tax=Guillardia theta TaxID=55529 RepID=L1IZA3_GUITC|nr:hypothetical protein GUITHDRAFT_112311 [Guillardia theta CCMP2712]EKX41603.1 hypothetical protein GUITHDRAFT_112311 [Guillardia theta CCMP2712]|eukprot:XP_005828583.1 hypothetical protein GUITHDRAFT_112311 [Guillardia theta CCMP2712]